MRRRARGLGVCLAGWVCALGLPSGARAQEARVESEWKLDVPRGLDEQVWEYLQQRYAPGPGSILPELGPGLTATFSDEDFIDDYYDDTALTLLRLEAGLRHRGRYFREDIHNRKHGRELLQLKGSGALVRSEQKWSVRPQADDWHGDPEENVPGLQLVSKGDRDEVRAALSKMGVDASDLIHVLQIQQRRRRVYIAQDKEAFATITIDQARPRKMWWSAAFTEVELELNEIRYTKASGAVREAMEHVNDKIAADLMGKFPGIEQDQTPKYNKAFERLSRGAWGFHAALVIGVPLPILALFGLGAAGLVVCAARKQTLTVVRWR